jgi:hypothetical protein
MSLKVSSVSSPSFPLVGTPRKQSCVEKCVRWVRNCEEGTTASKVGIFFLKAAATLLLFISIVGIPLYLALHKEYHIQAIEKKHVPEVVSFSVKPTPSHEPKETLAALKEMFSRSKEQYVHLKQYFLSLKTHKRELQTRRNDLLEKHQQLLPLTQQLANEMAEKTQHIMNIQNELNEASERYKTLSLANQSISDQIFNANKQIDVHRKAIAKVALPPLQRKLVQLEKEHREKLRASEKQISDLELEYSTINEEYLRLCRPKKEKKDRVLPRPRRFTFSKWDIQRSNDRDARRAKEGKSPVTFGSVQEGEQPIRNNAGVLVKNFIMPANPPLAPVPPSPFTRAAAVDNKQQIEDSKENQKEKDSPSDLSLDSV